MMVLRGRLWWLSAIIATIIITNTNAIIVDDDFQTSLQFFQFERFGFEEGGRVDMNITYEPPIDLWFLLCNHDEYKQVVKDYLVYRCDQTGYLKCEVSQKMTNGSFSLQHNISTTSTYHFLVQNCAEEYLYFQVKYSLMNADGNHLSTGHKRLPTVYQVLFPITLIFAGLALINTLLYWKQGVKLHRVLVALALYKSLCIFASIYFWSRWSEQGLVEDLIIYGYYGLLATFDAFLFGVLILIAKGYSITRFTILVPELKAIVVTMIAFAVSVFLYKMLGGFHLFAAIVVYCVAFRYTFLSLASNVNALVTQSSLLNNTIVNYSSNNNGENNTTLTNFLNTNVAIINHKLGLFKNFQIVCMFYVFCCALLMVSIAFFLRDAPWIELLIEEVVQIVIVVPLLWIFRLRGFPSMQTIQNACNSFELDSLHQTESPQVEGCYVVQYPSTVDALSNLAVAVLDQSTSRARPDFPYTLKASDF